MTRLKHTRKGPRPTATKRLVRLDVVRVGVLGMWEIKRAKLGMRWTLRKHDAVKIARTLAFELGGATVRIHTKDGRIQEERTYPRSADPRRSKG